MFSYPLPGGLEPARKEVMGMSTDTGTQDLKEFIRATLVEPPGKLSKELIKLCEGLIAIEPESKSVRMLKTKLTEQQLAAVPKDAIISITPVEHDYKLAAAYEIKKLSGYSPVPSSYSGNSGDIKYNANEQIGLDMTREVHPAFWRRKKDTHKEY